MGIINQLATSLNRRDEKPNQELAKKLSEKKDIPAIKELTELIKSKDKNIQSDCIKVLYEIGERNPELISGYDKLFIELLDSKNNRLVWGAMSALDCITSANPHEIYKNLAKILKIVDKGSVITRDHGVNILIQLASVKKYQEDALILLLEQFKTCPTNQLPMYAEKALAAISDKFKDRFIKTMQLRIVEVEKESKQKRIEKVIKKLQA
jgi:hypothetical protein